MKTYTLSASNGLCRLARARNFAWAAAEAEEYSENLQCQCALLDQETYKVLGRTHQKPGDATKYVYREDL